MKNKIIVFLSVLYFIIGSFFFNTNTSSAETSSTDYVPNQLIVKFKQNASLNNVQSFHKSVGANVLSKDDKLGFEVVQFSKGTGKMVESMHIRLYNTLSNYKKIKLHKK